MLTNHNQKCYLCIDALVLTTHRCNIGYNNIPFTDTSFLQNTLLLILEVVLLMGTLNAGRLLVMRYFSHCCIGTLNKRSLYFFHNCAQITESMQHVAAIIFNDVNNITQVSCTVTSFLITPPPLS